MSQGKFGPVGKFIDHMRNTSNNTSPNYSPQGCFKSASKNDAGGHVEGFYIKKKSKKSKKKEKKKAIKVKKVNTPVSETTKSTKNAKSKARPDAIQ